MALIQCENCKKDIVFYSNEETLCPHCSHKHSRSLKSTSLESQKVKIKKIPNLKDNNTGSVITNIDLPWGRVFWVSFQFLVVGLILAIPVWILFMVLLARAS